VLVLTVSLRCDDRGDIVGAETVKVEMQMAIAISRSAR